MMSVNWAKADIRLRASGSDFDPSTSASPRWGWSNLWRLPAPDRWASFVRKKLELNTKSHFAILRRQVCGKVRGARKRATISAPSGHSLRSSLVRRFVRAGSCDEEHKGEPTAQSFRCKTAERLDKCRIVLAGCDCRHGLRGPAPVPQKPPRWGCALHLEETMDDLKKKGRG